MASCVIYRGCHSDLFTNLLKKTLDKDSALLIVCPPRYKYEDVELLIQGLPYQNIKWIDDMGDIGKGARNIDNKGLDDLNFLKNDFKIGLFTSGTSGAGKKVVFYTSENFKTSTNAIYKLFEQSNNIFCYPQPYHIFGLSLGYIEAENSGRNLIVPQGKYSKKAHEAWLKASNTYSDLITLGTPTHFKDLISFIKDTNSKVGSTYSCILGGARVNRALWYDVQENLKVQNPSIGYGCTEASPGLFHLAPGEAPEMDGAIGERLGGVNFKFHGDGSFSFSGDNLSKAWLDNQGLHYCEELRVLDILKEFKTGQYVCTGRLSEMINRGGENFYPEDLEAYFQNKHSLNLIFLKKSCERLGEDFILLVEGKKTVKTLQELQGSFFDKFQRSLSEENIAFVEALPLNDSHKVDRLKCLSLIQKIK